ncbi:hypothetical protein SETIT_5G117300v2 [Setaria italica]|uniref:Uncharacterized protein n=1 Tax=Setaria italica TaxID=4555 RepID=K3XLJ0_SETIT|nr:uncharacterized protein LOC101784738 [Setaria italica]RCV24822.1 hypothetical protein SETIT_5G117300v2 [Setaria italica]
MAAITGKDKEEPLELKQGGSKVFSKLFTRESSAAAPSFRVYYGVASAGSVPFMWESQPGTPKNDAVSTATLPPLTPPPSYYTARQQVTHHRHHKSSAGGGGKKHSKQYMSLFSAILPKIILHRRSSRSSSSGSPSASSCSSSSSAFSSAASSASSLSFRSAQSPAACSSMRSRVYAFSLGDAAVDSEDERPPAPACFSVRHESFRAFKGCRVAMTVKSALASVGGHGPTSAQKV